MSAAEAEADEALFRGALDRRPGCAAMAASIGRLTVLSAAVPVAAGRSTLLAAPEASGGSATCAALLALAPVRASRLRRSRLPSVMTACCNSVIKVVVDAASGHTDTPSMKNRESRHLLVEDSTSS